MQTNKNYDNLEQSYLFSTIARKVREYSEAHPEADIIRLGIGDVTRPPGTGCYRRTARSR